MRCLTFLLVFCSQIEVIDSKEFSREIQMAATTSTVRIKNGTSNLQGSGAIIGRKGDYVYILTVQHLVKGSPLLEVSTFAVDSYPKAKKVYPGAELVAEDDAKDLALIRIKSKDDDVISFALCPQLKVPPKLGFTAFTAMSVGCGDGQAPTGQIGKVTGNGKYQRDNKTKAEWLWEVDSKYAKGRSGGPLIDKNGRLLGVLSGTATVSGTANEKSYFCHTEEIRAFLKKQGF